MINAIELFEILPDGFVTGKLIFIKGKLAANTGLTLSAVSQQLMSDIMCVAHNVVRVHSGAVDKSSVLRENPTLALFYVKSLLAS